jgi:hypothetical protein
MATSIEKSIHMAKCSVSFDVERCIVDVRRSFVQIQRATTYRSIRYRMDIERVRL